MSPKFLAQIDFNQLRDIVFPNYTAPSKGINITDPNLTLGEIVSALIPYLYILAGLVLFAFLIMGGFSYLTSGGDPKKVEAAQGKITHALIGFLIIFLSYWLLQILEIIFGFEIF